MAKSHREKYCMDCKDIAKKEYQWAYNKAHRNKSNDLGVDALESKDYVVCPICGEHHVSMSIRHFRRHGYSTIEEVKKDYPDLKLVADTSNNYLMNNPTKTLTDEERRQRSPFCKEHYQTLEEYLDFMRKVNKYKRFNTRLDFYLSQGLDMETAMEKLRERQTKNGLDYYVRKYGEDGRRKYEERMDIWAKKTLTGNQHSKFEKLMIEKILQRLGQGDYRYLDNSVTVTKDGHTYVLDFADVASKKAIEFFGEYWHCSPKRFSADDFNKSMGMTAGEVWLRDERKMLALSESGWETMVVWEDDDDTRLLDRCVEFMTQKRR